MSDVIFLDDPEHYRRVGRPAGSIPPLPASARHPEVKRATRPTPGFTCPTLNRYHRCHKHPWCASPIDAPLVYTSDGEWLSEREWLFRQGIIDSLPDRQRGAILPQRVEYDDADPETELIV